MELNEIANLDEIKKALRDKYLKAQLGWIQAGYGTLDDIKSQSDKDVKGSWIDWYSDPTHGGLSPDDFEEDSYDKDIVLKILNDKDTMPTRDEIVKYISDNLGEDNVADDALDKYVDEHESENTDISNIAKSITQNDLGRSL